jgi:glycerol-3-phosphate acyltransferase PlsY
VVAAVLRYSSLSALVAAALSPVWMVLLGVPQMAVLGIFLAALIFVRHEANIKRLIAGIEPKIGKKG